MDQVESIRKQWKRMTLWGHFRLGIVQMIHKQIYMISILMIIIIVLYGEINLGQIIIQFHLFKTISYMVSILTLTFEIVFPILLLLWLLYIIGCLSSKTDEINIYRSFSKKDLKNGGPILIKKKKMKNPLITERVWYSPFPFKIWDEQKLYIEYYMKEKIVSLKTKDKGSDNSVILMRTAKQKRALQQEVLYDDQF